MSDRYINWMRPTFTTTQSNGVINIVNSVGTTSAAALAAYADLSNSIRRAFDSAVDNNQQLDFYRHYGVKAVDLGRHMTSRLLFEGSTHPAAENSKQVADLPAPSGAGGAPAFGYQLAELMCAEGALAELLLQVRNFVIQQSNGTPCKVVNTWLHSRAGGMGAGALIRLALEFERALTPLGVPVETVIHSIGSQTFYGISQIAHLNDPCVLAALADFVTSHPEAPNAVRRAQLVEIGIYGDNPLYRGRSIAFDHQAFSSQAFTAYRERMSTNLSTQNRLGAIQHRSVQMFCNPNSYTAIQASCAAGIHSKLSAYSEPALPDFGLIKEARWSDSSERLQRASVQDIANDNLSADSMVQQATKAACAHRFSLIWDLDKNGQFDLGTTDHIFASPICSEDDLRNRRIQLATFEPCINEELSDVEGTIADIDAEIAAGSRTVQRYVGYRDGTTKPARREKYTAQIVDSLKHIRDLSDTRHELVGKKATLLLCKGLVAEEQDHLQQQIADILRALNEAIGKLGPQRSQDLVGVAPLSVAMPVLLQLPQLPRELRFDSLFKLGGLITLKGMQEITGAILPRVEEIADALVLSKPTFSSPPLGAHYCSNASPRLFILPPMEAQNGELLRRAIGKREPQASVFFADTFNVGPAVVVYQFQSFKNVKALFPGVLWHDLKQALESETPMLRFPSGTQCLDNLGINVSA